jgi:5-hydroxytryptamine receptor 7
MNNIYIKVLIGIACVVTVLLSLLGNTLVIIVISRYKRLKNATNYVLLSLAIADLTVSLLVMPPTMTQDVLQKWIFSDLFCKFYNSFDITCCTASILR